jgi:hypothetical protein
MYIASKEAGSREICKNLAEEDLQRDGVDAREINRRDSFSDRSKNPGTARLASASLYTDAVRDAAETEVARQISGLGP